MNAQTTGAIDTAVMDSNMQQDTIESIYAINSLRSALIDSSSPYIFYVHIRSDDGIDGTSSKSDFTIGLRSPLVADIGYGWSVSVKNFTVPYSFYQVNDTNRFLDWSATPSAVYGTIGLESGTYSPTEFATELQRVLNIIWGPTTVYNCTISVTFLPTKYKLQVVVINPSAQILTLHFAQGPLAPSYNVNANWLTGFQTDISFLNASTTTQTSQYVIDLMQIDVLHLRSDLVSNNSYQTSTNGQSSELHQMHISSTAQFGNQLTDEIGDIEEHNLEQREISTFRIQLTDTYDNLIDLNGLDWSFTLAFRLRPTTENIETKNIGRTEIDRALQERIKSAVETEPSGPISIQQARSQLTLAHETTSSILNTIASKLSTLRT